MNKKIKIVFSVLLMTAFIFNSQKVLGESKKTVSILFTHDMHSHIDVERNVKDGKERESGGLAKVKTVKDRTEDRYSGTFLVDAGDFAMGTPFQTVFRERASELKTSMRLHWETTSLITGQKDLAECLKKLQIIIKEEQKCHLLWQEI